MDIPLPSNRKFGLLFFFVFLIIGTYPALGGKPIVLGAVLTSIAFLFFSFLFSGALTPLNWLWMRFGLLLHKIVNPVVMGFIFYCVLTPLGLAWRAAGKDSLQRKFLAHAPSYWIKRDAGDRIAQSMRNQF